MSIKANNIRAKKVTGVEIRGGAGDTVEELVRASSDATAIEAGDIDADDVTGFRYIADPQNPKLEELRAELERLRSEIAQGKAEAGAPAQLETAETALAEARDELARPEPKPGLVVPKLEKAAKMLTEGSKVVDAAGKLSDSLAKWGPLAASLAAAAKLVGG